MCVKPHSIFTLFVSTETRATKITAENELEVDDVWVRSRSYRLLNCNFCRISSLSLALPSSYHYRSEWIVGEWFLVLKPLEVNSVHIASRRSGIRDQFSTCLFTWFSHSVFECVSAIFIQWKMESVEVAETSERPFEENKLLVDIVDESLWFSFRLFLQLKLMRCAPEKLLEFEMASIDQKMALRIQLNKVMWLATVTAFGESRYSSRTIH